MNKIKAFGNTTVSYYKTMDECQRLLSRYGVKGTRFTNFEEQFIPDPLDKRYSISSEPGKITFEFQWSPNKIQSYGYKVEVSYQSEVGPKGGRAGITKEQAARALFWHIKNLIEAVEFGIVDMEQAFLPYMLMPNGNTVYDVYKDRLLELPRPASRGE